MSFKAGKRRENGNIRNVDRNGSDRIGFNNNVNNNKTGTDWRINVLSL
jgi:hypothetical protein